MESGETLSQVLSRELWEELGIELRAHAPLIRVRYDYPERSVLLDVHSITDYAGVPAGLEGQPLRWLAAEAMSECAMPPADRPIVTALRLPDTYLICALEFVDKGFFLQHFQQRLAAGQKLIQLRAPGLDLSSLQRLAEELVALCRRFGARLLLNSTPQVATACGADGVHLNSRLLMSLDRRPLPPDQWVAASCHNLAELQQAELIGADFAVLSPVLATMTHPEAEPLGWAQFQQLVDQANIPVYALGGMRLQMVGQVRNCGGQGIAAIRGLWDEKAVNGVG